MQTLNGRRPLRSGQTRSRGQRLSDVVTLAAVKRSGNSQITIPFPTTLPGGLSSTVTNTIKALDLDTDLDDLELRDVQVRF